MRFFTSDLHFGHRKVAELRGFDNVEDHDDFILDIWDSTVGRNDIVYVLGDISLNANHGIAMLAGLPGRKHLISGNHDMCHPRYSKAANALPNYLTAFDTVASAGSIKINGERWLMSHYPYTGDSGPVDRDIQWRLPNLGMPLLHGHVHSQSVRTSGIEFHVGWDAWGRLVSENEIA